MGKYETRKRHSVSSRTLIMLLAVTLLIGCAIGGTVAWLTATTDTVTNTFTYGDINIELAETTGDNYKIIPGVDISKDPKVTVEGGSEDCWLFVKVKADNWPIFAKENGTLKVAYAIDNNWTQGDGMSIPSDVYYRAVTASNTDQVFGVLSGDKITVSDELTKADIKGLNDAAKTPKLTFTAYAVQQDGINTAADAWDKVPAPTTTNPQTNFPKYKNERTCDQ